MAVYCGMLVALVVRDPGVEKFTRCRFHESYNEHGRGRWKAAGNKGDGRRAKRLHREVRPRALEGEPLIFDPDFDTPTPYTDEKTTAMMIEAMEAAGTPGHLIYAYRKTGMIKGRKMPDCGPKRRSTNGMPRWRNMRHCTDQLERKNSRQCCACRRSL